MIYDIDKKPINYGRWELKIYAPGTWYDDLKCQTTDAELIDALDGNSFEMTTEDAKKQAYQMILRENE